MCYVKWNMDPNKIYSQSSHQPNVTSSYGHSQQQQHHQHQQPPSTSSSSGGGVLSGNDIVPKGTSKMTVCSGSGSGNHSGMGGTNNSTGGNFVNVVPISMGQQHQYHHRRKLTPQEYQ